MVMAADILVHPDLSAVGETEDGDLKLQNHEPYALSHTLITQTTTTFHDRRTWN
jgi:hypothetical protein